MNIARSRPAAWGKAWSLYRRKTGVDSEGDPTAYYDMDTPDFSAQAGEPGAVPWQVKEGDAGVSEPGERLIATATGRLYGNEPEVAPFDRLRFDDTIWEVRSVMHWPNHRKVMVVQV